MTDSEINEHFNKSNKIGNEAAVIVDMEHEAVMRYTIRTGELQLQLHYQVKDKYGNLCSF